MTSLDTFKVVDMSCDKATQTLLLETEPSSIADARRHQATCPACTLRSTPQTGPPEQITQAIPSVPRVLRLALLGLGVAQLIVTLPWLIGLDPFKLLGVAATEAHQVRDGALGLVVSVAAILAAANRRYGFAAFVFAAVALVAQAAAGLVDDSISSAGSYELVHLVSIVTVCLTGLAAMPLAQLGPARSQGLRSIDRDS